MSICLLAAAVLIDFSQVDTSLITLGSNPYRPEFAAEQLQRKPWGLVVNVDVDKINPEYLRSWTSLGLKPELGGVIDWYDVPFEVVFFRKATGRIRNDIEIDFVDATGETFQFPEYERVEDEEGNVHFSFRACENRFPTESWRKISWGGNADRKMDRPVRLSVIHLSGGSKIDKTGQATLAKIVRVGERPVLTVERTVRSLETISTDTTYPGAKPFSGADRIAVRFTSKQDGKATLRLAVESNTSAMQARSISFEAPVKGGVAMFETKLPYETGYQYLGVSAENVGAVAEVRGQFTQTAAEAMRLDVETGNDLHLATNQPTLVLRNPARQPLHWTADIKISDVFGREIALPFDCTVGPGEAARVAVPWPLPAKGVWYVKALVKGDDGSTAERTTQFAWIDRHEVTPEVKRPEFRFGIHYHGSMYLPNHLDRTIDAIVATGAKLVRTDYSFMFSSICPTKAVYEAGPENWKWENADLVLKKLRAAGLSLDIIIYGNPNWSWDPDGVWTANPTLARHKGCRAARPGLFREFCRHFAARYKGEIDYYEIGNEWDATPILQRTLDDAERMHREGYEGVHAGYPEAVVVPNGWAYLSSELHGKVDPNALSLGLVERFHAKPELWDGWVFHNHGLLPTTIQNLEIFQRQQEKYPKLKTCPWFLNESGLSSGSYDEVTAARTLWAKPLLARSRGAAEHVWYNLRATGWFKGSEPGFGIISAGYYPRAAFAAFAALTRVFKGLKPDGEMYSKRLRQVLRFKGDDRLVLAAWDLGDKKGSRTVRLKTDAKSVELVDFMGNGREVERKGGGGDGVGVTISANPIAVVLKGATTVEFADFSEIDAEDRSAIVIPPAKADRKPDFVLDLPDFVHDIYANDPDPKFIRRLWTGPKDHSAKIWLERAKNGGVRVKAQVVDDIRAAGDGIEVFFTKLDASGNFGQTTSYRFAPQTRDNGHLARCTSQTYVFDTVVPFADREFGFDIHVLEDDGDGLDGYLRLRNEVEPPLRVRLD